MHGFVQKVRRHLQDRRLIAPGDRVLACVSGGPDSVALLRALCELGMSPDVAFVDHGVRAEAAAEGAFVGDLAGRLALRFHAVRCHPESRSEEHLREARYAAIEGLLAETVAANVVATGHTASDQAETVLMRILRGAGVAGLGGIPPRRGRIVRPLLVVTRAEVLEYLDALGQEHRVDPTNACLDLLRNRVRHETLPMLANVQPGIERALCRLADAAASDRSFLESAARSHLSEHGLGLRALRSAHPGLVPHIVRLASPVPIPAERMAAIVRVLETGGEVQMEGGVSCVVPRAGRLRFRLTR